MGSKTPRIWRIQRYSAKHKAWYTVDTATSEREAIAAFRIDAKAASPSTAIRIQEPGEED